MISDIRVENKKVVETYIENYKRILKFEDGTTVLFKDAYPQAYCACGKIYDLKRAAKVLEFSKRIYRCKSCSSKGVLNSFYGKQHSKEFKDRLSIERKGKWYLGESNPMYKSSNYEKWVKKYGEDRAKELQKLSNEKNSQSNSGEKNGFFGKKHSKESREKVIAGIKKYNSNLTLEEKIEISKKLQKAQKNAFLRDPAYYKGIKQKAALKSASSQSKYKKNKFEQAVEQLLLPYTELHYAYLIDSYQYDFKIKNSNILIECHGDYWHANPLFYGEDKNKRKINKIQQDKIEKDRLKAESAVKNGMILHIVWEHDFKKDPKKVLERILNEIKIKEDRKN